MCVWTESELFKKALWCLAGKHKRCMGSGLITGACLDVTFTRWIFRRGTGNNDEWHWIEAALPLEYLVSVNSSHSMPKNVFMCGSGMGVCFFFPHTCNHVTITDPLRSELETLCGWLLVAKHYILYVIVWHEYGSDTNTAKVMQIHH